MAVRASVPRSGACDESLALYVGESRALKFFNDFCVNDGQFERE